MTQIILGFILLAFLVTAVPADPPPETDNMTISIDSENLAIESPKGRGSNLKAIVDQPLRESVQDTDRYEEPEGDTPYPDEHVDDGDNTTRKSEDELKHTMSIPSIEIDIPSKRTRHELYDKGARSSVIDAGDRFGIKPTKTSSVIRLLRRNKRAPCPKAPPGERRCIPCRHESPHTFIYTDPENYFSCMCDSCTGAHYLKSPCTCTARGTVATQTKCAETVKGETYMPYHNWCRNPFPCTSNCPGNLIIIKSCKNGADAICGCPANMEWLSGPTTCSPIPLCDAGYQSVRYHYPSNAYPTYDCEECKGGYIQPRNNTLDQCYLPPPTESPSINTDAVPRESGDLGTTATTGGQYRTTQRVTNQTMDDGSQSNVVHIRRPVVIGVVILIVFILLGLLSVVLYLIAKDKCRGQDRDDDHSRINCTVLKK